MKSVIKVLILLSGLIGGAFVGCLLDKTISCAQGVGCTSGYGLIYIAVGTVAGTGMAGFLALLIPD